MSNYRYILFDVAGTLLHKPTLYTTIVQVLKENGYTIDVLTLKKAHKLVSEVIHFPDRTDKTFYQHFNSEVLYALGILPNENLLNAIFDACSYLPWEKFEDTKTLDEIELPMGIISNFNTTLKDKLADFFGPVFKDILVSEELGIAKPAVTFYEKAVRQIGMRPEEILYIGDSVKLDIEPATNLGIRSLLIDREGVFPVSKHRISSLKDILTFIHE